MGCENYVKIIEKINSYNSNREVRIARFVSIEGGEGVGKSLFIQNIAADLTARGVSFVKTREPGGTPAADKIRALFGAPPDNDPFCMMTEALLVSAARAQHVERVIRPALERGHWVLSDRYADSTRVYQGVLGGVTSEALETLIDLSTGSLMPDLTFLLDCDVHIAAARRSYRATDQSDHDDAIRRYDDKKIEFHERLRRAYLSLKDRFPDRIVVLDAARAPAEVAAEALAILKQRGFI